MNKSEETREQRYLPRSGIYVGDTVTDAKKKAAPKTKRKRIKRNPLEEAWERLLR
tara:strand:- start:57 stop:221 length:165 start_codon:yes stop_codon:yes gene_type:complete